MAWRTIIICLLFLASGCAVGSDRRSGERFYAWQAAYQAAGKLDSAAEPHINPPDYYRRVRLGALTIHLCGPEALRKLSPSGGQCALGGGRDGAGQVWVLAGPEYISQWGLGHEMGHLLGYKVDDLVPAD